MKSSLVPGVSAELKQRVVTQHLVSFQIPGAPPVLASPWVLYWMETAAYRAIEPHLDPGEVSLGVRFEFEHLAPTPAGRTVTAKATVAKVDGRHITVTLEAHDGHEPIVRGTQLRVVVQERPFLDRVSRKRG